jgi:hypothetical protein
VVQSRSGMRRCEMVERKTCLRKTGLLSAVGVGLLIGCSNDCFEGDIVDYCVGLHGFVDAGVYPDEQEACGLLGYDDCSVFIDKNTALCIAKESRYREECEDPSEWAADDGLWDARIFFAPSLDSVVWQLSGYAESSALSQYTVTYYVDAVTGVVLEVQESVILK